jgi:tRNA U34 5-methylaminomethyl-2-thiouridine-forming methyltransferase MnmC
MEKAFHQKLVVTEDGSHTLYVSDLNEHYHSVRGALQESVHVFINAGLSAAEQKFSEINLLEVGFGTGLNCLLTYFNHHKPVNYVGVEAFPVEESILGKLNYHEWLQYRDSRKIFQLIHHAEWDKPVSISPDFHLTKLKNKIQHVYPENYPGYRAYFNLIYFDAFAPDAQPEMWTAEMFNKLYDLMTPKGILVTYCAKGSVKRNMKSVGFIVESLPGAKGKREMTRAIKE